MGFESVAERRKVVQVKPCQVWRKRRHPGSDRHIGGGRTKILPAPRIAQCPDRQRGQQDHGPVFRQHGAGGRHAGQCRKAQPAAFKGTQKEPRRQRPPRHHRGIGVELERMKIEERDERQQSQSDSAL